MPQCPKLSQCLFFNNKLQNMPAVAEMTKTSYCRGHQYDTCARFKIASALGTFAVPDNLFPDQHDRIPEILKAAKR